MEIIHLYFLRLIINFDTDYHSLIHFDVESLIHNFLFCCTKSIFLQSRNILSPVFVLETISTMAYRNKTAAIQRRTTSIREQHAAQVAAARERFAIQAAAILRRRTRTKLYNDAARSAADTLRQHRIVPHPHSRNNARRISQAARTLRRLTNPGPFLIEGPAPHAYYVNAEVTNVEDGERQQFHFDHRHSSPD